MKPFEFYLDEKEVKKVSVDPELAKSLIKDMNKRIESAQKLDINEFSKIIFENIYDALRDFCDALLAQDGYKSYSHQASIAYLKKYGFSEEFITKLDMFRYKRNGSKYYGREISFQDAEEIKQFYISNSQKIRDLISNKFLNKQNNIFNKQSQECNRFKNLNY